MEPPGDPLTITAAHQSFDAFPMKRTIQDLLYQFNKKRIKEVLENITFWSDFEIRNAWKWIEKEKNPDLKSFFLFYGAFKKKVDDLEMKNRKIEVNSLIEALNFISDEYGESELLEWKKILNEIESVEGENPVLSSTGAHSSFYRISPEKLIDQLLVKFDEEKACFFLNHCSYWNKEEIQSTWAYIKEKTQFDAKSFFLFFALFRKKEENIKLPFSLREENKEVIVEIFSFLFETEAAEEVKNVFTWINPFLKDFDSKEKDDLLLGFFQKISWIKNIECLAYLVKLDAIFLEKLKKYWNQKNKGNDFSVCLYLAMQAMSEVKISYENILFVFEFLEEKAKNDTDQKALKSYFDHQKFIHFLLAALHRFYLVSGENKEREHLFKRLMTLSQLSIFCPLKTILTFFENLISKEKIGTFLEQKERIKEEGFFWRNTLFQEEEQKIFNFLFMEKIYSHFKTIDLGLEFLSLKYTLKPECSFEEKQEDILKLLTWYKETKKKLRLDFSFYERFLELLKAHLVFEKSIQKNLKKEIISFFYEKFSIFSLSEHTKEDKLLKTIHFFRYFKEEIFSGEERKNLEAHFKKEYIKTILREALLKEGRPYLFPYAAYTHFLNLASAYLEIREFKNLFLRFFELPFYFSDVVQTDHLEEIEGAFSLFDRVQMNELKEMFLRQYSFALMTSYLEQKQEEFSKIKETIQTIVEKVEDEKIKKDIKKIQMSWEIYVARGRLEKIEKENFYFSSQELKKSLAANPASVIQQALKLYTKEKMADFLKNFCLAHMTKFALMQQSIQQEISKFLDSQIKNNEEIQFAKELWEKNPKNFLFSFGVRYRTS